MDERSYWIGFSVFPGIGPVRFRLLLEYFGSAKSAWLASESDLTAIKLSERIRTEFIAFRKSFDIDAYRKKLEAQHVGILTLQDKKYPSLLAQISDAPFVLYVKGSKSSVPIDLARTIGVVGTRHVTSYGAEVTERLVIELVSHGFTIVSGLAYGVDAIAHKAAIKAGGNTIAVLGCGIDIIAPSSNANLYTQIADGHGAIVSEMPLGMRPNKGLFPARNRIISGLSLGIIVTEGADDSGALITARNAGEQGREVFAVPGPITSLYSRGPAKLLKNGAKLVESADDILEELGISQHTNNVSKYAILGATKEEQMIIDSLQIERMHINTLVHNTNLTIAVVASTLTVLEMKKNVKDYGGKVYGLCN